MRCATNLLLIALAGAALTACSEASNGRYPSLLPRPIESQSFNPPPPAPPPPVAADPALDKKIADSDAQIDKAREAFKTAAQGTEALVANARGVAEGSNAWLDAQVALADLDVRRSEASQIVAGLENIALERGVAGKPPYPALDAVIARANTLAKEESERTDALDTALKSP